MPNSTEILIAYRLSKQYENCFEAVYLVCFFHPLRQGRLSFGLVANWPPAMWRFVNAAYATHAPRNVALILTKPLRSAPSNTQHDLWQQNLSWQLHRFGRPFCQWPLATVVWLTLRNANKFANMPQLAISKCEWVCMLPTHCYNYWAPMNK